MSQKRTHLLQETIIFFAFILLTLLMTYPVIFNLEKARNLGDPLFISWNLAWDVHKLFTDPLHLFQANIFYPNPNTLAYSEHLFGLALFSIPVFWFANQPIIAYNVLALFSFILSGYGTYLFAKHLTQNRLAGFIAGIIFAFFPYKIYQYDHLHVISTQWIAFAFLSLHKFLTQKDRKNMFLFILFYVLQILSSGNLAVFFNISILGFGLFLWIQNEGYKDGKLLLKIIFTALVVLIVLIPFYLPYVKNQEVMGFTREKATLAFYSAKIENYLACLSHLYTRWTTHLGQRESYLSVGFLSVILAILGLVIPQNIKTKKKNKFSILTLLDIIVVLCILFIIITLIWGCVRLQFFSFTLTIRNLLFLWGVLVGVLLLRKFTNKTRQPFILSTLFSGNSVQAYLLIFMLLAISLSLGINLKSQLYSFFYHYFPGFKWVRVPARMGIFVSFFISILAAYGVQKLMRWKITRRGIFLAIPLILIEYASFPIGLSSIKKPSRAYGWLANQKDNGAVIELPIESFMLNIQYLYHSTHHWKKLVNGYSGFFPPCDDFIQLASLTNFSTLCDYLRHINVKYIIVHKNHVLPEDLEPIKRLQEKLLLRKCFETEDVYELGDFNPSEKPTDIKKFKQIQPRYGPASSNQNTSMAHFALDGHLETEWHSQTFQQPGIHFTLDLGDEHTVCGLAIELGKSYKEYPRKLFLQESKDGIHWKNIDIKNNILLDLLYSSMRTPKNIPYLMIFESTRTRFIQLELSQEDETYWSIPEIKLFGVESGTNVLQSEQHSKQRP